MQLYYPHKPYLITQKWGNLNPAYSEQFDDPNFKRHNGIDAFTGKKDWQGKIISEFPVHCPVDGFKVESVSFDENGGGNQIALISKTKLQIQDKLCYVRLYLLHGKKILVPVGYEPELGEIIMVADNTGFSTGIHTHFGMYRLNDKKKKLDTNEATGSFDPSLFFTGKFAVDVASSGALVRSYWRYYKYLIGL